MDDAVRTDVLRKMRVKSGMGVQVWHAPAALAGLAVDAPGLGAVLVFVERQVDVVPRFLEVLAGGTPGAPVWVAYPKGGARAGVDLNRDTIWKDVQGACGWQPVAMVALDASWSALRFRPGP